MSVFQHRGVAPLRDIIRHRHCRSVQRASDPHNPCTPCGQALFFGHDDRRLTGQGVTHLIEGGQSTASTGEAALSALGLGLGFYAILFTDIVQSTDHRSQFGDAEADRLHAEVDAITREAIERNRGIAVKGLGDGIMAIFRSPTEAVQAGVVIQGRLRRRNQTSNVGLHVRIGIATGEVDITEVDVFGYPVNEASRLCSACETGGILVTELAASLARRAEVKFVQPREVPITPSAPPTIALLVEAIHEQAPFVPLTGSLAFSQHGGRFVGRARELTVLMEQWHRVRAGSVEVAVVTGEPGLGKTTLLGEFAREVSRGTGIVLYGRCDERVGAPYQPFAEAFGHFVQHCPDAELRTLLQSSAGELSRIVPALGARLDIGAVSQYADLESERWRLHEAVGEALRSLSVFEPVVLILDDLHWAGTTSVDLLERILRDTTHHHLMVVLSLRSWDPQSGADVAKLFADRHRITSNVGELAAEWKQRDDVDESKVNELWEITAGNPLFVSQVLRTTLGDEIVPVHVPQGVVEVIDRQLDRLTSSTKQLLGVAALLGNRFEVQTAAQVAQIPGSELFDDLDEAALAGLVKPLEGTPLRYEFNHALVRRALEDEISSARRRDTHGRIAAALEVMPAADPDDQVRRLAFHWSEAGEFGDPVKGAAACLAAAEYATSHLAIGDALELLERAERLAVLAPDLARDTEIAVARAEAMCLGAFPDSRAAQSVAIEATIGLGDARLLARAALAHSRAYFSTWGRSDAERIRALELALEACDAGESAVRAQLMSRLANELTFVDGDQRRYALTDEALRLAHDLGDPTVLAGVLLHRQYILAAPQFLAIRLREGLELEDIAVSRGDRLLEIYTCVLLCGVFTERADVVNLDQRLARLAQLNDEVDLAGAKWQLASVSTGRTLFAGKLKEASALAKEALTLGIAAGQPDAFIFAGAQRMQLNYLRGRLPSIMDTFLETTPEEVKLYLSAWVTRQLHLAGRVTEAEEWWQRTQDIGLEAQMEIGVNAGLVLASWAYLASVLPSSDEIVDKLRRLLTPLAGQLFQQLLPDQPGHHFLGLLCDAAGEYEAADVHFADSVALLERISAPVMAAITQVAWARSLQRRGETARATDLARQALASATQAGATQLEHEANEILEDRI